LVFQIYKELCLLVGQMRMVGHVANPNQNIKFCNIFAAIIFIPLGEITPGVRQTMETQLQQIREQQKQSWNKFSPGWKKWDTFNMAFLRPMGEAIVRSLDIHDTDNVLDIAAGTGEPGITIAELTPNGMVTGTDLADDMLATARENAVLKGLKNYETLVADVCELPFSEESFDAISCRMGFMFFPDMQLAADEMYRVLKPGGRIATAVWSSPAKNNWITTIMSVIGRHIQLPAPMPASPGMFRCAAPGLIADIFRKAGFKNIKESEVAGKVDYQSFDRYWNIMLDVGAPIVAAFSGASEATINAIKAETAELFASRNSDGCAVLNYGAFVVYGEK
jgi:ubiquinone/menaquinone biosynthesis C-methylase UbiE